VPNRNETKKGHGKMPRERSPWYGDDREYFETDDLRYRDRDYGPMSEDEWARQVRRNPYEDYYERRYGRGYNEWPRRDPRYDLAPTGAGRYSALYEGTYGTGGRRQRQPYGGRENYARDYRARRPEERDFWDKASDEISSWLGDEEAERRRRQDQYRGHGPKGYTRSDERIKEDVSDRLSDDPSLDASGIEVSVESHEVTLSGEVYSRYDKRRAEDIAEDVSGVTHVQNNLRVNTRATGPDTGVNTSF